MFGAVYLLSTKYLLIETMPASWGSLWTLDEVTSLPYKEGISEGNQKGKLRAYVWSAVLP